ncbi:hypothetical protein TSUD_29730 [Trifolium subterraneum]|uniref:Uncharacterized protein n=1 Tax=Trifolium subterraneum TaxID=3900 RepID=A0A2Z6M695_TRISU|nr:hypothetical protein TSUD_29730 [Trifolium subterraneum]
MESVMKCPGEAANSNIEEGSSSDLDFVVCDAVRCMKYANHKQLMILMSDGIESAEDNDEEDTFMRPYSDAMNEELKETTLQKSFVRAEEQVPKKDEGTSHAAEDMDNDFSPIDVDVNLLKSLLDSFSSQQGLPGPASNLLGLMGVQFPQDTKKSK